MVKIKNLEEKQLLVARHFIIEKENGKEFRDKDIFQLWTKYFPADFWLNRKKYGKQKFIYQDDTPTNRHLTLPDKKGIPKYVIDRYNTIWENWCCVAVNNLIEKYTLPECNRALTKLRKKHQNIILRRCYEMAGYGEICNWPISRLSIYGVYVHEESYTGNYEKCLNYIRNLKQKRLAKGEI